MQEHSSYNYAWLIFPGEFEFAWQCRLPRYYVFYENRIILSDIHCKETDKSNKIPACIKPLFRFDVKLSRQGRLTLSVIDSSGDVFEIRNDIVNFQHKHKMMKRIVLLTALVCSTGLILMAQEDTDRKKTTKPAEAMMLRVNTRDRVITYKSNNRQYRMLQRRNPVLKRSQVLRQRRMMAHRQRQFMQHRQRQIQQRTIQRQMMQQQRQRKPAGRH